jgi:Bardet-Biedl syndrome 2 protein
VQVVKAEDNRLLGNMKAVKSHYRALRDVNRDLHADHGRRIDKHSELTAHLRTLNRVIFSSGRLRLGPPRDACVAACRAAVQAQDAKRLLRALREGC